MFMCFDLQYLSFSSSTRCWIALFRFALLLLFCFFLPFFVFLFCFVLLCSHLCVCVLFLLCAVCCVALSSLSLPHCTCFNRTKTKEKIVWKPWAALFGLTVGAVSCGNSLYNSDHPGSHLIFRSLSWLYWVGYCSPLYWALWLVATRSCLVVLLAFYLLRGVVATGSGLQNRCV